MFCSKCGKALNSNVVFCPGCGAKVVTNGTSNMVAKKSKKNYQLK